MSLHIIRPGLQTSIQDGGRPGWMRYGVARGGAADPVAMHMANTLLQNSPTHPCLEITLTGPEIAFEASLCIAVCGARFDLTLNDEPVANDTVLPISAGDRLSFGRLGSGARAYLAMSAEMDVTEVFNSCATHLQTAFGGFLGRALRAGDRVPLSHCRQVPSRTLPSVYRLQYGNRPLLRVVEGAEAACFGPDSRRAFFRNTYRVSADSNRMGIRLQGIPLNTEDIPQMVSSGLCPGTVQIPAGGEPIIAFVEAQTLGGYPRIAHVIEADQPRLAQLKPGDRLDFERIEIAEAQRILQEQKRLLAGLEAQLREERL
ncbi:biotin-dependent carboxyltransferase family protein [Microbulbifer bruguierae]|uniref:Biotin-dependent carboxyltransferase family protein n=1 Tax=Microbulbifer bruguierae TaxID=3029061 RepID=A0ABY8NIG3_9GAMM|nr:biotin-dependent carboxyltransferase family protein [Microbulbifer bruguierae]WGL18245.1 biotin-dependent carboxyltransferase family protein [Microbulbifer bruguierae]